MAEASTDTTGRGQRQGGSGREGTIELRTRTHSTLRQVTRRARSCGLAPNSVSFLRGRSIHPFFYPSTQFFDLRARVLHFSSGAVYGDRLHRSAREDDPAIIEPSQGGQVYDAAKVLAETLCTAAAFDGVELVVARLFSFVGPGIPIDAHFAAGSFLQDALEGRDVRVV